MNRGLLDRIKTKTLSLRDEVGKASLDFEGVYIWGTSKPFSLSTHQAAFHAFRVFSEYRYPINLFINPHSVSNETLDSLKKDYDPINVIHIPVLDNIFAYSNFLFYEVFPYLKCENLLCFQEDGFLIQKGWEDYVMKGKYDFIGAPWKEEIGIWTPYFKAYSQVGNGGFSFRKRVSMMKIIKLILNWGTHHHLVTDLLINDNPQHIGSNVVEDALFGCLGYGLGIFEPISVQEAQKFSHEPIEYSLYLDKENHNRPFGFHKIDQ